MRAQYTIDFVERQCGEKLTYPNQYIRGSVNEKKYEELRIFGCSDIWDECGAWLHRDCFSKKCKNCNFYPIVKKYNKENNIKKSTPIDFTKFYVFVEFLSKIKNGNARL